AGFLYASAGLALLYAALDQGERLDWWRSGVFTALVASGGFFLLCAAVRRLHRPNSLVDLPYFRQWNTVVLGFGLFALRFWPRVQVFCLPASVACAGFRGGQSGSRRALGSRAGAVPRICRRPTSEQGLRLSPVSGNRLRPDRMRMP